MNSLAAYEVLREAGNRFSKRELAKLLEVNESTFRRWEVRQEIPAYRIDAIRQRILPLVRAKAGSGESNFRFIDLFAGIGGIRSAFESQGGQCVFTSEWNAFAQKTYLANFPPDDDHVLAGDITKVEANAIPDHDVLLAGFPCQPFSIAGVSKKNALGRPHGFECTTQGTLFYDVARIIAAKKPKAFVLENVKNLVSHDGGNTFARIKEVLTQELGYVIDHRVIDGRWFTPQHRERIIIVGFAKNRGFSLSDMNIPKSGPRLDSVLHKLDGSEPTLEIDGNRFFDHKAGKVQSKYTLTSNLWSYLQAYADKHKAAGNGFGFGLVDANSVSRTLSARYYKDGSEILLSQGKRKRPRRLTPRECARLMGFPDSFQIPVSDTQAYRQFGNSVVVPVLAEVARIMKPFVIEAIDEERSGLVQESLLVT